MKTTYKSLENPNKGGIFTIKIEDNRFSFHHTKSHKKDEYEDFEISDYGTEFLKNIKIYHINGYIITLDESRFLEAVIEEYC